MRIHIPLYIYVSVSMCVCVIADVGLFASDVLEDDFFNPHTQTHPHTHTHTPTHTHTHTHTQEKISEKALQPTATDKAHWNDPFSGPVELVCPEEFSLADNMCFRQIIADPIVSCPYGSFRNKEGVCVSVDSVPPEKSCPYGFEWYLKGCIRRHIGQPTLECQTGFMAVDDLCVSRRDLSPKVICPSGFEPLSGDSYTHIRTYTRTYKLSNKCVKTSEYESTPTCPHGFHLTDNDVCERQGSPSLTCPESYTIEYDFEGVPMCVQRMYLTGESICPSDLHFNPSGTMCVGQRVTTARYPCFDTGKRRNSLLKHITSEAKSSHECTHANDEKVCDVGSLIGGECVEDISVDPMYIFEALGDTYPNTPTRTHVNGQCRGANVVNENGIPVCEYVDTKVPINPCTYEAKRKSNLNYDLCREAGSVPIQYHCQDDDKPSPDTGLCIHTEFAEGQLTCPDGADVSRSGLCPSLLTSPMTTVCPDGYREGHFEGAKTGMCEKVEYANAQEVCPVGYERDAKHVKDNKKACVAEKVTHPVAMCEPGFFSEGEKCVKTVKLAPSLMSPDGDITACRPSVDGGGPSCGMEMKYYAEVTEKGKKKGEKRKKRFMIDRLV